MASEVVQSVLKIFAPSVSEKMTSYFQGRKLNVTELNWILIAILAEQNVRSGDLLQTMNKNLETLNNCMNKVGEDVAVIKLRTEKL